MTIKNETAFTKECMEGAMRACEAGNSRYKTFKLIYKLFGIIFAMMMVREFVMKLTGNVHADTFMILLFGVVAVVFLYIGVIGMDKSNRFSWNEVVKWNQDSDNMYLFVGDDNCLVVSKKGFTQESADDLRQLADAVIGMRDETGNSQQ